jgi:hypothetical protein
VRGGPRTTARPNSDAPRTRWRRSSGREERHSPDEKLLYVVEARATPNRLILAYDVDGARATNRRTLIDCGPGTADGIKCDTDGNLWCAQRWWTRSRAACAAACTRESGPA